MFGFFFQHFDPPFATHVFTLWFRAVPAHGSTGLPQARVLAPARGAHLLLVLSLANAQDESVQLADTVENKFFLSFVA